MKLQNDNWGHRARFGVFIVGSEAVPEAEWWAMLPDNISVHAARITAPAPWATWQEGAGGVELSDDLERGTRQFASMSLSAVVIGHSSSSLLGGKGWDEAVVGAVSDIVKPETTVTTNGLDTLAALRASGVKQPFLVLPPWFNDRTLEAGLQYFNDHGLEPAGTHRYDPGPDWRDVPFGEMYPRGLGFQQEVEPLYEQILASCPAEADGVLIAGTGFRCVAILEQLEQKLDRPALSANQASLWNCMRLSGIRETVTGYGNLFQL